MLTGMTHANGLWYTALSPDCAWNQGTPIFSPPAYFPDQIQDWAIWLWLELVRTCFSFLLFFPPSAFGKCWHFSKGLKTQTLNIFHWKMLGEREGKNPQTANNQISFAFKSLGFMKGSHIWRKANSFYENICSLKTNFLTIVPTGICHVLPVRGGKRWPFIFYTEAIDPSLPPILQLTWRKSNSER